MIIKFKYIRIFYSQFKLSRKVKLINSYVLMIYILSLYSTCVFVCFKFERISYKLDYKRALNNYLFNLHSFIILFITTFNIIIIIIIIN